MRLIVFMIAAEILAMLGSSAVAATLPDLIAAWRLGSAQAGVLSGAYFFGYAAAVPILVTLTDRFDARSVFIAGAAIGAAAGFGFAFLADGLWSAIAWWALAGVSLAGVYMPGLRVIIDRLEGPLRLRAVPYYTASFGIGVSLSFFAGGSIGRIEGWRAAFAVGGAGCLAAILCLILATAGTRRTIANARGRLDLQAVFANRTAMRYIAAYGGHCWELFALRAWLVALLVFAWERTIGGESGGASTYWSALISLAGVPASIVGAEYAMRLRRSRVIVIVSIATIIVAAVVAAVGLSSFLVAAIGLLLYNVTIVGDSGALTAGVVETADEDVQGSTLALHSLVGFAGGGLGPIAVGLALNAAGGLTSPAGWYAALAVMACGSAFAALAVRGVGPSQPRDRRVRAGP